MSRSLYVTHIVQSIIHCSSTEHILVADNVTWVNYKYTSTNTVFEARLLSCEKRLLALRQSIGPHVTTLLPLKGLNDSLCWLILLKSFALFQVSLKRDNNDRHFTRRPALVIGVTMVVVDSSQY